jgi:tyrosyl-tRNA synthetase
MALDNSTLEKILHRGVVEIIVEEEFVRLLKAEKPLRLKMGFDPSSPDIHIGHVVGLRKLRQLQELGHRVVVIVGDWTARIGDPSGQSATRKMLTAEEVKQNAETYMQQLFKVIDKEKTDAVYQSEWYGDFDLEKVIRLTSKFTVAQFLAREDFSRRFKEERPIAITELLYPLLQAYDSVAVRSDVEFGGTDQKFNLLVGRELQGMEGQRPQQCFLVPLLVGTDGRAKMSKSLGNAIGVTDPPQEQYGKVMSLPDGLIPAYFDLVTDTTDLEIDEIRRAIKDHSVNPMELKKRLAREIVGQFHNTQSVVEAEAHFERVVQRGEAPDKLIELQVSFNVLQKRFTQRVIKRTMPHLAQHEFDILQAKSNALNSFFITIESPTPVHIRVHLSDILTELGVVSSRSEAKRLISQDAMEVNGDKASEETGTKDGDILRIGRRRYIKLINSDGPQ